MSSVVEPNAEHDVPRSAADGPQLRTILLTDLVESTALVEQLGDGPAADLFREHDRLVVGLQQQWRGRLIDRSDGLLLLFERAIDGLGFALDYNRGLRAIGESRKVTLQARTGLHVGEVLSWRNSDVAVSLGAKPLEVEGLAKPFAARLMTLARPGQILLSAVAEPLAHRAARELGERGEQLLWKSYGRWCFKGIPEAQEIYEVGEAGVAPLRAPKSTAKSWRDIPFWRRPAALGAELLLVAGLATGTWFLTRPQPAIAFGERDWVVVGDLRNLTGDKLLDDSLQQAFRISLEQSRFVNVLSDLKSRDTLALMQRKPGTALDRAIASEIALRDGARAVILPTVSEVGGRVRVSAEVIDPHTQTTVYAESADGTGAASTLDSIDTVTAALRGKLGEALQSIEKDSEPLPKVSTGNLDALRAYALGQKAYARGHELEALQFYERATELDPEFALAWIGQVRARFAAMQAPAAVPALRRAKSLRSRLPPREALYLDAWASVFEAPSKALGRWQELASLYPDYWPAQGNTTIWLYNQNRFSEALPYIRRQLVPQNETAPLAYDFLGRVRLGMEQYPQAAWAFDQALAHGYKDSLRRRADVEAAQRKFSTAQIFLNKVGANDRYSHLEKVSIAVDQAKWNKAQESSRSALALVAEESGFDSRLFLMPTALADWLSGDSGSAMRRARAAADKALTSLAQAYDADAEDDASLALSAGLFAQRLGDVALAKKVLAALALHAELMTLPNVAEQATLLRAADARLGGQPEKAIELLKPLLTGHERYQTRVELQEACAVAGQVDCALEQAHWLLQHRGLAYMEQGCGQCLQALNVADSNLSLLRKAELLSASGKPFDASRALADFDQLWPPKSLPIYLRTRRAAVLEASSRGGL